MVSMDEKIKIEVEKSLFKAPNSHRVNKRNPKNVNNQ